ncbi:MAG: hypothetical protein GX660_22605, partial [Clostridiaceae bacterium]|nr:hypothetical protein [Clostridiaceae bacterium]
MRSKFRVPVIYLLVAALLLSQPLPGFATVRSFIGNQASIKETSSMQNEPHMLAPASAETVAEEVYSSPAALDVISASKVEATSISDLLPPSSPTNLNCTSKTDKSVTLSWTAPTDDGGSISGYSIYNKTKLLAEDIKDTNYTVADLTAGTTYSFTVRAKDDSGNVSEDSTALIITTLTIISSDTALFEDKTIGDLYIKNGAFNLNGYKLNVNGNVIISGGTLNVNGGQISISGDLRLQAEGRANDGSVTYGNGYGQLKMVNATDYVLVGGGYYVNSYSSHNGILTAGVLEVKGDFWQKYSNSNIEN